MIKSTEQTHSKIVYQLSYNLNLFLRDDLRHSAFGSFIEILV